MWSSLTLFSLRAIRAIITALAGLPRFVYLLVAVIGLLYGGRCYHRASVAKSFTAGYASALDSAARVAPVYRDRVVQLAGKTDTAIKVVTRRVAVVESVIVHVPDSVRTAFPVVDTALRQCSALAQDCAKLRDDMVVERAARDSLDRVTTVAVVAARDSVRTFQKRPTRKKAAVVAVGSAILGWLLGSR